MGLTEKMKKRRKKNRFYEVLWPFSPLCSTLNEINLSETSFKHHVIIYIYLQMEKVSVPSTSAPRTKNRWVMKCRAVFIKCVVIPQAASWCRQTPVEAISLFSYCLEFFSAQVSLPICHKWLIRVILKQRELSLISQFHLQNVRPLVFHKNTGVFHEEKPTDAEAYRLWLRHVGFI